ncbi:MAG TPA: EamA family transporter RarD [Clostridiales bacterium UBA8960]|nr:EamA family transporter RarD [Clostridiales bacterium UBA8960]
MDRKNYVIGLVYGASAFTMWGLLPLYWKLVNAITPYQIFAQRVVWSFVFITLILVIFKKTPILMKALKSKREWKRIVLPSILISVNWLLYIWGVNNNFVIETSLGYYINPLVLTLFGFIFYKERLNRYQKIGIGLATLGVLVKTVLYGKLPIVALVLAVCFGSYGLLKKKSNLDSLTGLGFETLIIGIPSLIYMGIMEFGGNGITGNLPNSFWILISLSGIVTATPLLMYAESTKKLPLNVVGFLQYISPTIALMLGIFVFGEPFDIGSLIAFSLIWLGLGFFSYSQFKLLKR